MAFVGDILEDDEFLGLSFCLYEFVLLGEATTITAYSTLNFLLLLLLTKAKTYNQFYF